MPRYISKGGAIKCHAYQFLDNANCEVYNLAKVNPDVVKVVGGSIEPRTISVVVDQSNDVSVVPLHYYLVFYNDGEVSIMSPEIFRAHYMRDNPFLRKDSNE